MAEAKIDWKQLGVRVVRGAQLAAITATSANAQKIWAGTVTIHPDAKTGPHHHGELESIIYVVSGQARMRWGERLEYVAEAGPGDFIFVPPFVPHQEINANSNEPLRGSMCRVASLARRSAARDGSFA